MESARFPCCTDLVEIVAQGVRQFGYFTANPLIVVEESLNLAYHGARASIWSGPLIRPPGEIDVTRSTL
jgi:hypothetical protein